MLCNEVIGNSTGDPRSKDPPLVIRSVPATLRGSKLHRSESTRCYQPVLPPTFELQ